MLPWTIRNFMPRYPRQDFVISSRPTSGEQYDLGSQRTAILGTLCRECRQSWALGRPARQRVNAKSERTTEARTFIKSLHCTQCVVGHFSHHKSSTRVSPTPSYHHPRLPIVQIGAVTWLLCSRTLTITMLWLLLPSMAASPVTAASPINGRFRDLIAQPQSTMI